jgi:hypothetical protein
VAHPCPLQAGAGARDDLVRGEGRAGGLGATASSQLRAGTCSCVAWRTADTSLTHFIQARHDALAGIVTQRRISQMRQVFAICSICDENLIHGSRLMPGRIQANAAHGASSSACVPALSSLLSMYTTVQSRIAGMCSSYKPARSRLDCFAASVTPRTCGCSRHRRGRGHRRRRA